MRRLQLLFFCSLLVICLANGIKKKTLQEIQSECKDASKSYDVILKCIRTFTYRTKRNAYNCNNCCSCREPECQQYCAKNCQQSNCGLSCSSCCSCSTNSCRNYCSRNCPQQNCENQCDDCSVSTRSSNNCCQKNANSCSSCCSCSTNSCRNYCNRNCPQQNCENQCDDCSVSTRSSNNCCQKSAASCREPACRDSQLSMRQSGQEGILDRDGININLNDSKSLNTSSSSGLHSTTSLNQTFHIANNVNLMNNISIPVYANASSINTIHINLTSPSGGHTQTVTKTVPIPVPQIIQTEKRVPILVPRPYPVDKIVNVDRPVPYPVAKPYPVVQTVHIPVEKRVPYPVERIVPYPQVRTITVPVEKAVPYPVPQPVPQPVPYPIERPVPYPVVHRVPVSSPCTLNSCPTQQPCCMVQPKQICTGGRCSQGAPYQSCGPHCFIGGFGTTTSTGVHPDLYGNAGCAGLNCLYQGGGGIHGLGTLNFGLLNTPYIGTGIPWNTGLTTGGVTNYGPHYTGLGTAGLNTGIHSLDLHSGIGATSVGTTGLTSGLNPFSLTSGIGGTSVGTTGLTSGIGGTSVDTTGLTSGLNPFGLTSGIGGTSLGTTQYQNLGSNIAGQGSFGISSTSGCTQGTSGCGLGKK